MLHPIFARPNSLQVYYNSPGAFCSRYLVIATFITVLVWPVVPSASTARCSTGCGSHDATKEDITGVTSRRLVVRAQVLEQLRRCRWSVTH